jgi:MerR family mercuric resistance operon transcriptional regulator
MQRQHAFSIGELSRRSGCNIETIRYYERIGILPPAARTASRYRVFSTEDVRRLRFIRRARELDFTLDEIRALLALAARRHGVCAQARALIADHLREVRAKIVELKTIERMLIGAIGHCNVEGPSGCAFFSVMSSIDGILDDALTP